MSLSLSNVSRSDERRMGDRCKKGVERSVYRSFPLFSFCFFLLEYLQIYKLPLNRRLMSSSLEFLLSFFFFSELYNYKNMYFVFLFLKRSARARRDATTYDESDTTRRKGHCRSFLFFSLCSRSRRTGIAL